MRCGIRWDWILPAEPEYSFVMKKKSSFKQLAALLTRAAEHYQQDRLDAAETVCREVLRQEDEVFDAHHILGLVALDRGKPAEAERHIRRALAIHPGSARATLNLGVALRQLGREDEALACCAHAIALQPDFSEAYHNRGNLQSARGEEAAAAESFRMALLFRPDFVEAGLNLGQSLLALGQVDEALAVFEDLCRKHSGRSELQLGLAAALAKCGRFDAALAIHDERLRTAPQDADAWVGKGDCLYEMQRVDDALACHAQARTLAPDHADANWNAALCHLLRGEFEQGWPLYESGWHNGQRQPRRQFDVPRWEAGMPVAGKRVLLHAEQGFGDTFQFCRYARLVKAAGAAEVILEVQPALRAALTGLAGVDRLLARGEALPAFDLHCPLLSLPGVLGTRLESIPVQLAYLAADTARCAAMREALGPRRALRVGLAWSGSRAFARDRRPVPLAMLRTLFDLPVEWVCIQKEIAADDAQALKAIDSMRDASGMLADFADTAALISELDMVISVDTAVAHLAAALGKPTWLMLAFMPDWRWMLGREDSPWYPTVRLFRQRQRGDWQPVVDEVGAALRARLANGQ